MKKSILPVLSVMLAVSSATRADLVSKDIGDPDMNAWKAGDWVTCGGEIVALDERPEGTPKNAMALRLVTKYGVRSFGGWTAELKHNTLPGKPKKLTGWMRLGNDKSWGFEFKFQDANTNEFGIGVNVVGSQYTCISSSCRTCIFLINISDFVIIII